MPIFRGKNFVSSVSEYKDSVRVATRSNVNLTSNVISLDGVSLVHEDRVLLLGQTATSENGIYVWSNITKKLSRAYDADSIFELSPGSKVYVEEGNNYSKSTWTLITQGVITPGVTALVFAKESRVGETDLSGIYGAAGKTLQVNLDETGLVNSITAIDIEIDGGTF